MKTATERYVERQMTDPAFRKAYEEETMALDAFGIPADDTLSGVAASRRANRAEDEENLKLKKLA